MMGRRASRFDPQAGRPVKKTRRNDPEGGGVVHELQVFHPPGVFFLSMPRAERVEVLPVLLVPALSARLRRQFQNEKRCKGLLCLCHSPYCRRIRFRGKNCSEAGVRENIGPTETDKLRRTRTRGDVRRQRKIETVDILMQLSYPAYVPKVTPHNRRSECGKNNERSAQDDNQEQRGLSLSSFYAVRRLIHFFLPCPPTGAGPGPDCYGRRV